MRWIDAFNDGAWAILESRLTDVELRIKSASPDLLLREVAASRVAAGKQSQMQVVNGVAVLPIFGTLGKRADWVFDTSMEQAGLYFADAIRDPSVRGILLHVDSPGGTVDGTLELARMIREGRGVKPIISLADGFATSAAYWIASAADKVFAVGETTTVGSIGVIGTHFDLSGLAEKFGIRITHITAGKFKAVGSPFKPLDALGFEMLQGRVNDMYEIFLRDVAKQRGATVERVRTEMADARLFLGEQAVRAGLIDGFATMDSLVAEMSSPAPSSMRVRANTEASMKIEKPEEKKETPAQPASATPSEKQIDSDAIKTATAEAVKAERERIAGIDKAAEGLASNPKIAALVAEMKADGKTTPDQAATRILALVKEQGVQTTLAALKTDAPAPVPSSTGVEEKPNSAASTVEQARKLGCVR